MRIIDLLHRWTGGLVGLLLAVLGLSGALLVHKSLWIIVPHANDAKIADVRAISATVERLMADPATRPDQIRMASEDFGLYQLGFGRGAGAYADQAGNVVARWDSQWARPELWLFDLHHHLFAGEAGEVITGILGLVGIGFVVTGFILWWRLRKTFEFRLWPARMSRPAIVRHHRDLGVVLAPLLFLSMLTGAMMVLKPVSNLLLRPFSPPAEMRAASAPPNVKGGPVAGRLDWGGMVREAHRRFPNAEIRTLTLPREPGELISMRLRQPEEWLPNGRTTVWFLPESGKVAGVRDGTKLPLGSRIFNMLYPLHAATVGGLPYRLVMTVAGLGLTLLGTLAVWSFWFKRNRKPKAKRVRTAAA
jgi:uncharacterized iron-regulated membrane protein